MFITRPDAQIYSVEFGAGPRTFVALGGWIGSWEVWADTLGILSRTWRTIAYDHRGSGATIAAPESISAQALLDDLFAVLDAYRVEQCVIAAESAGTVTALQAVLQQPARFSGVVVVDGLYRRKQPAGVDPFVQALTNEYAAMIDQFIAACLPEEANRDAMQQWGRRILGRSTQAAAIRLYECLYGIDLRPQAAQISHPCLIIHGDADRIVPAGEAEWLAAHLPVNQLVILPGAGHVPTMTRPEAVAGAIDRYFAQSESV